MLILRRGCLVSGMGAQRERQAAVSKVVRHRCALSDVDAQCQTRMSFCLQRDSDEDVKNSEEGSAAQTLLDEVKDVASPE